MVLILVFAFLAISSPMFVALLWTMARLTDPRPQRRRIVPQDFDHCVKQSSASEASSA
jgi:hypothetical protein